jgi:SnoaL-like domain
MEANGVVTLTRLFTEGLNARDVESLLSYVTDDVVFRSREGSALRGQKGVEGIVNAATDSNLVLVRTSKERVDADGSETRVTVPVRELVSKSDLDGTAQFELRDGKIAAFRVVTAVS